MTDSVFNNDGALFDAFGALQNRSTGLGTTRDKTTNFDIPASTVLLTTHQRIALFRSSRLARRAVETFPRDAGGVGWQWVFGTAKKNKLSTKMAQYCERIKLRQSLVDASIEARLHGDGYILIGVADGQDIDKPIGTVRTIEWLEVLSEDECIPWGRELHKQNPEFYTIATRGIVHGSRILRLRGDRLLGIALRDNGGKNDSVLQTMLNAYAQFSQSVSSSAGMLVDYSVFKYKLKDLAKLVLAGKSDELLKRFISIQMGMSITQGLMMDAESEEADFIQRNYSGVDKIVEILTEQLVAASDMPRKKLLGSSAVGGLGTANRGDGDREDWAIMLNEWQRNNWLEPLDQIKEIILSAQDGPTKGRKAECSVIFSSAILMNEAEKADLRLKTLQGLKIAKEMDVLHPDEIRQSLYGGTEFSTEIQLIEGVDIEKHRQEKQQAMETALEQQQTQKDPDNKANGDGPQHKQDTLDLADFAKIAQADLDRARLEWERNPPSEQFQGILAASTEP